MTSPRTVKYNPAFLSEEELVRAFVVRHDDLELVMEIIRENEGKNNQHILVVAPRGAGKTTLVLRVAEELRRDKDFSNSWYPIVYAEESYGVSTPGEFWLEAIFHLGKQTRDERWKDVYEDLRRESDENRLRERALAQLLDFSDQQKKRLLVAVENLNMLLGEQITDDDAWKLRHTLLNEPRLMLLGTATSRFEEIDNANKAMFELFKIHELRPLDTEECRRLWRSVAGQELSTELIRPIQILTGGNPRLVVIVATFGAHTSFGELMGDLIGLVDEHTEYFKNHLDRLPPVERKVFAALADIWQPATAREVSEAARIDVNMASAYLQRLLSKGAVAVVAQEGRKKWYQVSERMYNIYHLMRRRGQPSDRVRAIVDFMIYFYREEDLVQFTRKVADEACLLTLEERMDHYAFVQEILKIPQLEKIRTKIIEGMPGQVVEALHLAAEETAAQGRLKDLTKEELEAHVLKDPNNPVALVRYAFKLLEDRVYRGLDRLQEAEDACDKALSLDPRFMFAWLAKSEIAIFRGESPEAEICYRRVLEIEANDVTVLIELGELLAGELGRPEEGERLIRRAIEIDERSAGAWCALADLLKKLARYEDAERAYRRALEIEPENVTALVALGQVLATKLGKGAEGEQTVRRAIEIEQENALPWRALGNLLKELGRYEDAENAYRKALEIDANDVDSLIDLGGLLSEKSERHQEAEEVYKRALGVNPYSSGAWSALGLLLAHHPARYEEAENAILRAVEFAPIIRQFWSVLIDFQYGFMEEPTKAVATVERLLDRYGRSVGNLNYLAALFLERGYTAHLELAEKWSREAVKSAKGKPEYKHTLSAILGALGNWKESLEIAQTFISAKDFVQTRVKDVTEYLINAAAAGYAEDIVPILEGNPGIQVLEPVLAGVKAFLGEDYRTAQEIHEVGQDVAKRITERMNAIKLPERNCPETPEV